MEKKLHILFLCTGNSCRSQMAEGWARKLLPEKFVAMSAGTNPQGLNPLAARVMLEVGIDISTQTSKHIDSIDIAKIDAIISVCDAAREACPILPTVTRSLHISFADPPTLAKDCASVEEALLHYRRVRDEIREFVEVIPEFLNRGDRK